MSKSTSGVFHGTSGASNAVTPPLFYNGHVTYESIAAHREEFMGKSVEQIGSLLKSNGYEFNVRDSKRKDKGSTAIILEITNSSKERNIKQVQVSPNGSSRHGNIPYVKLSTSDERIIKVIDGTPKEYVSDGKETARLIFRREQYA